MPDLGATDPADLEAKARAELGFSRQLEQPRRVGLAYKRGLLAPDSRNNQRNVLMTVEPAEMMSRGRLNGHHRRSKRCIAS
jgi:hypothetical protein